MESLQMGIFPCLATLFRVKPRQDPAKRGFAAVRPGSALDCLRRFSGNVFT